MNEEAPKPKTGRQIAFYTVERDGKPTRISERLAQFPHGVLKDALLDCEPEERSILEPTGKGPERTRARKRCLRIAQAAIERTKLKALELENSIHYDAKIAKQIGSYESEYVIIREWEEVER